MTDKERLQANNAKIEEIKTTLANKVITSGEIKITENNTYDVSKYASALVIVGEKQKVEITLPNEFAKARYFYYCAVSPDKFLMSSDVNSSGLWLYNRDTDKLQKIYSVENMNNCFWGSFQQVTETKWLIGKGNVSGSGYGVLLYDSTDDNCSLLYEGKFASVTFTQLETNKWFVATGSSNNSSSGCAIYNSTDDSFVLLYDKGYGWRVVGNLTEHEFVCSSYYAPATGVCDTTNNILNIFSSEYIGSIVKINESKWFANGYSKGILYLFDYNTRSLTELATGANEWVYVKVNDDKWLCSPKSSSSGSFRGIISYDVLTNQVNTVYDSGKGWGQKVETYNNITDKIVLLSSERSDSTGLLRYNAEDDTCIQINSTGYNWKYFYNITDKIVLVSCGTSSGTGLLRYNAQDDTYIQVYANGYSWRYFANITSTKCFIGGVYSGILQYDLETDTCVMVYNNTQYWNEFFQASPIKWLISGDNDYLLTYDLNNNQFVVKTSHQGRWKSFYQANNKLTLLSSSDGDEALWGYDNETGYLKAYSVPYGYYNIFTSDGENIIISSSDKTKYPATLYFNASDETVSIIKYYVGEF